jgi:hypothetical protein
MLFEQPSPLSDLHSSKLNTLAVESNKLYNWPPYEQSATLVTNHFLFDEAPFFTEFHATYKPPRFNSLVSVGTRLHAGRSGVWILVGAKGFLHEMSRPTMGPTQPLLQWVLGEGGCISLGDRPAGPRGWAWKLELRMSGALPLLPSHSFSRYVIQRVERVLRFFVLFQFFGCWTQLKEVEFNYSYRRVDLHSVC